MRNKFATNKWRNIVLTVNIGINNMEVHYHYE